MSSTFTIALPHASKSATIAARFSSELTTHLGFVNMVKEPSACEAMTLAALNEKVENMDPSILLKLIESKDLLGQLKQVMVEHIKAVIQLEVKGISSKPLTASAQMASAQMASAQLASPSLSSAAPPKGDWSRPLPPGAIDTKLLFMSPLKTIVAGGKTKPHDTSDNDEHNDEFYSKYVEKTRADVRSSNAPTCTHWLTSKNGCLHGKDCTYYHRFAGTGAPIGWTPMEATDDFSVVYLGTGPKSVTVGRNSASDCFTIIGRS